MCCLYKNIKLYLEKADLWFLGKAWGWGFTTMVTGELFRMMEVAWMAGQTVYIYQNSIN